MHLPRKRPSQHRSCEDIFPCQGRWIAFSALLAFAAISQQSSIAQGLLGKRYVEGAYQLEQFDDGFAKDLIHDIFVTTNLPLSETWDFQARLDFVWFADDTMIGSSPISYEFDATSIRAGLIKHFRPEEKIDPFAGIGIRYSKFTALSRWPTVNYFTNSDFTSIDFSVGFEWKLSERLAVRPQVTSGDTLEDFNIEEVLTDNIDLEMPIIFWWNENWFSTFAFATDFDDSDYGLRFSIGYGEW